MVKIAFCGKMASGKTTLANNLLELLDDSKKYSFAEKVKEFGRFLFDIPQDVKDRDKFQRVGDGARKYISGDVWIDAVLNQCYKDNNIKNFVLDDMRYENELLKLKKDGWYAVLVDIDDELQVQRIKKTYPHDWEKHLEARNHISETEIDTIDKNLFDLVVKAENNSKPLDEVINFIVANQW